MTFQADLFETAQTRSQLDQLLQNSRLFRTRKAFKHFLDFVVRLTESSSRLVRTMYYCTSAIPAVGLRRWIRLQSGAFLPFSLEDALAADFLAGERVLPTHCCQLPIK